MNLLFEKDIKKSRKPRKIFYTVMDSLNSVINYKNNKCYFIEEPRGSGKSYLLNYIICKKINIH